MSTIRENEPVVVASGSHLPDAAFEHNGSAAVKYLAVVLGESLGGCAICPVSPATQEPQDGHRSPPLETKPTPQGQERKLARVSFRQGDSWRAAAVFLVPQDFTEDQVEAAATPIAEALGQHEMEITGSVEGLACDIHLLTRPDGRDENDDDPILASIERCIPTAPERAARRDTPHRLDT